jgi:hypothetical protein
MNNNLDEIIKNQMILSFKNNTFFRFQLTNAFNTYYMQNIKYHIMWLFFHSFSFAYPDNPSDEYKIETANFLTNVIPKNLTGCGSCSNDYKIFIEKLNIFRIVSSKQELSNFFVDLHNYINNKKFEQSNRQILSSQFILNVNNVQNNEATFVDYDTVKSKYAEIDYITLLETKYNINMFKLIEDKNLSSFYEHLNKLKLDSSIFNINIEIL